MAKSIWEIKPIDFGSNQVTFSQRVTEQSTKKTSANSIRRTLQTHSLLDFIHLQRITF